ncbi:MAG: RluA family pseudouridine synthase [Clostridia bacterium]|nr:RluA family pseudouridine synthase [Clostridia bacterium]
MMRVEILKGDGKSKISQLIFDNLGLPYNTTRKIIRNKDVKVNGKRVAEDLVLKSADELMVYYQEYQKPSINIVYQDENIVIVFKTRNVETVAETGQTLQTLISEQLGTECYAVHRLDRNTEGLVVFALNAKSKAELDKAFKNRTIDKYYLALANGLFKNKEEVISAYLKKDAKKSVVYISNTMSVGFEKIITQYKVIGEYENSSLVEVKLITGKTHQIRAHLAHIGHFVIGDEKYGDSKINKQHKKRYQCLCAYKLKFNFDESSVLNYLNNRVIELEKEKIDFCQNL